MNIVLCCAAKEGKGAYTLSKGGKVIIETVFQVPKKDGNTLKNYTLQAVYKGILSAKKEVSHDDLLLIEVGNVHLCDWLNGSKEYKGYEEELDNVSQAIEGLDCRYLFATTNVLKAKRALSKNPDKVQVSGIDSLDF